MATAYQKPLARAGRRTVIAAAKDSARQVVKKRRCSKIGPMSAPCLASGWGWGWGSRCTYRRIRERWAADVRVRACSMLGGVVSDRGRTSLRQVLHPESPILWDTVHAVMLCRGAH